MRITRLRGERKKPRRWQKRRRLRSLFSPPAQQDDNNRLFFIRMLENMVKLNELMEQLMDVVIPKYVGDMKDNLNVNADVICERLKNCEDKLEAIKANTRKRGL